MARHKLGGDQTSPRARHASRSASSRRHRGRRGSALRWVVAISVLVVLVTAGPLLLLSSSNDQEVASQTAMPLSVIPPQSAAVNPLPQDKSDKATQVAPAPTTTPSARPSPAATKAPQQQAVARSQRPTKPVQSLVQMPVAQIAPQQTLLSASRPKKQAVRKPPKQTKPQATPPTPNPKPNRTSTCAVIGYEFEMPPNDSPELLSLMGALAGVPAGQRLRVTNPATRQTTTIETTEYQPGPGRHRRCIVLSPGAGNTLGLVPGVCQRVQVEKLGTEEGKNE